MKQFNLKTICVVVATLTLGVMLTNLNQSAVLTIAYPIGAAMLVLMSGLIVIDEGRSVTTAFMAAIIAGAFWPVFVVKSIWDQAPVLLLLIAAMLLGLYVPWPV